MNEPPVCPKCGTQLPEDAPAGLCPKCLVRAVFESEDRVAPEIARTAPSPAASGFEPPSVEELTSRFPQLEILELLGKGGMGAVYKARQKELDRLVAVKVLPPEVSADPAFAERFTREARALARLSHPHIVAVYDFGRTGDGLFYFVMEYVDGVNLRQALQSGGMLPQEALAIVPQICDALQFAHDEGIVHRDIKPENILIDKKGRVKIADFGLAKLLGHAPGDLSLTGTQQVMGTLHYMAPEQIEATKAVDHRADIYSLGVVFYELLTGELPIGRFAPPSKKVQIDVRLDEVVLRALEKEPEQRYQQVSEVKTGIEAIRGSAPVLTPVPTAPVPDAVLRPRLTMLTLTLITVAEAAFLGLQAGYLAGAEWYSKQELPYGWMSAWCVVFTALGGACLAWWWYLLAKSPDTTRSVADFLRTMQSPDLRTKRLWLPLGIFFVSWVTAIAVSTIALDDTVQLIVVSIPFVLGPYLFMVLLWRVYGPAAAPAARVPASVPSDDMAQDAREILAVVMRMLLVLAAVGIVTAATGLSRVSIAAIRDGMERAPTETFWFDACSFGAMLTFSSLALFLLERARRQGRDGLARVSALSLVIVGCLFMLVSQRWFGVRLGFGVFYAVVALGCGLALCARGVRAALLDLRGKAEFDSLQAAQRHRSLILGTLLLLSNWAITIGLAAVINMIVVAVRLGEAAATVESVWQFGPGFVILPLGLTVLILALCAQRIGNVQAARVAALVLAATGVLMWGAWYGWASALAALGCWHSLAKPEVQSAFQQLVDQRQQRLAAKDVT